MNVFYLSKNQRECAAMHVDKHCVKMILEYAQILSTAHRILDAGLCDIHGKLYQTTHANHPSSIWARTSVENYSWLLGLLRELCEEYTFRYNKVHKVQRDGLLDVLSTIPFNISHQPFSEPPKVMPDACKVVSTVVSYYNYYNLSKRHIFKWKNRPTPNFVTCE